MLWTVTFYPLKMAKMGFLDTFRSNRLTKHNLGAKRTFLVAKIFYIPLPQYVSKSLGTLTQKVGNFPNPPPLRAHCVPPPPFPPWCRSARWSRAPRHRFPWALPKLPTRETSSRRRRLPNNNLLLLGMRSSQAALPAWTSIHRKSRSPSRRARARPCSTPRAWARKTWTSRR